jgi:hypothetical protein
MESMGDLLGTTRSGVSENTAIRLWAKPRGGPVGGLVEKGERPLEI